MSRKSFEVRELKTITDARGSLFEMLRFREEAAPAYGYIYTFTINPGQRRGDHYHEQKEEWFCCVSGKIRVAIETTEGCRETIALDSAHPMVIYCGPYTAHALYNESDTPAIVISYGSIPHNEVHPDTFRKVVE
jgi:dTDP-4-dehydrorhamnose 3,5-epimerase